MKPAHGIGVAAVPLILAAFFADGRAHSDPAVSASRAPRPEWRAWASEAFAEARESSRPILLAITPGWDHWSHQMDRDAYSDSLLVAIIRERYVPVRVDPDRRPDIDRRYNGGGWPTTAVLTPAGDLLRENTHVESRLLGPLLLQMSQFWRQNRAKVLSDAEAQRSEGMVAWPAPPDSLPADGSQIAYDAALSLVLGGSADLVHGGIGIEPKFPAPAALRFALAGTRELGDVRLLQFARTTLDSMEAGAIYDRVGGGFHRYSNSNAWNDPAFEKLLGLNADLLEVHLDAFEQTGDSTYLGVARRTARYLCDRLYDPRRRLFRAAEDADDYRGEAGGYYRWTASEIRSVVPGAAGGFLVALFGFDRRDLPPGAELPLARATSLEDAAARARLPAPGGALAAGRAAESRSLDLLDAARRRRPPVALDTDAFVDGNAAAAIALLHLARVAPAESSRATLAREVLNALAANGCDPGRPVPHWLGGGAAGTTATPRELALVGSEEPAPPLLRDQVFFARALLEQHLDGGDPQALADAIRATDLLVTSFTDSMSGALLDRVPRPGDLPVMALPLRDIEENGRAACLLLAMAELTGEPAFRAGAARIIRAFLATYQESGYFAGDLGLALLRLRNPAMVIAVAGDPADPTTAALRAETERVAAGWVIPLFIDTRANPRIARSWGFVTGGAPSAVLASGHSAHATARTPAELRRAALRLAGGH